MDVALLLPDLHECTLLPCTTRAHYHLHHTYLFGGHDSCLLRALSKSHVLGHFPVYDGHTAVITVLDQAHHRAFECSMT
jgi:hypothetical protein